MSLLDDIGAYLASNGIGTVGTDIFLGRGLTATPDAQVGLQRSGGFGSIHAMRGVPGQPIANQPRIQIVCRALTYPLAEAKANAVNDLLDGLRNTTINTTFYHFINSVQEPFLLQYDDNNRPVFVQNFDIMIRGAGG